jgi:hypothetical protein
MRRVQHHKKHIKNKFGHGEDRAKAVQFFKQLGGFKGYQGLLERFMVNVEPSIQDEDEKQEIFEILQGFGTDVVPAIAWYLKRGDSANVPIAWPLKLLASICNETEASRVIIETLEQVGTSYTRQPERKQLLIAQLAEYKGKHIVCTLIPFLHDHSDEVRLETLDALTRLADESAREAMLDLLVDKSNPIRLRAAVAGSLMKLGWNVKGYRKKVEQILPEGLSVDRAGRIKGLWVHE